MIFRHGYYELGISEGCSPKLKLTLQNARHHGYSAAELVAGLTQIRAEVGAGSDVSDLDPLPSHPNDFGVTIGGYRFHLRINQQHLVITVMDVARLS